MSASDTSDTSDSDTQTGESSTDTAEYFEQLREKTFADAIAENLEIVVPTTQQLQIDRDKPWPFDGNEETRVGAILGLFNEKLTRVLPLILGLRAWKSRHGNTHIEITLDRELSDTERIALQAVLGSDPMRELCNLRRVLCGADTPIALFKPKQ